MLKVDDDWVDTKVLTQFAELLEGRRAGKRFTYIDLKAQDCLVGCATEEQREWLRAQTGLAVEWLR